MSDITKPESANLFMISATDNSGAKDVVVSFYYEWMEPSASLGAEKCREKVASVVLSLNNAIALNVVLANVISNMTSMK